ncbi:malate dehydrogenase (quinone) [Cocleimonas sp. KMM 6892]|uniref:malate dehydrogenase (quinone) n=1 Tax=unclassified Cocleimonas TaxID=2639732 RepID=UPI002DBB23CA|nr:MULTISPECIES: malate dehydrogenase (quinone) [unclassified Cocleimonas]MEB8434154.1 malate dehydrogenase (quinone) [Cocleimonas sp. KMM 6892]MEC4716986.1 malate dehydrogenase (quinone) [Cocleimonas sp. KMM 6895]MEC4746426.1 malate dehydrogenase (quinone) [Cocleimonas sp. KMM 6896]
MIKEVDILLVGAGAMSATLGSMLKQLDPDLSVVIVERLDKPLQESSDGWNNAGTGHAAYCELNYTPQQPDGSVNVERAYGINARYEVSLQYWSYLVKLGALPEPTKFINPVPHVSFVWGEDNVEFLRKRHAALIGHPMFAAMEFSEDPEEIKEWMPLVMEGRDPSQKVAATRVPYGTDVNFAAVSLGMIEHMKTQDHFDLLLNTSVKDLKQDADKRWAVSLKDEVTAENYDIKAGFVFIGAGGASLPLLQKSGIPEGNGYGGFPVSGQFLVCKNPEIVKRHMAKVYGKASVGAPPMSVPHLDARIIGDEKALLFGPFAGSTTKFLKKGSVLDLFKSIRLNNIWPMMRVGMKSFDLIKYLIKETFQSSGTRMKALREYYPEAKEEDWTLLTAGQRVQIIKKCEEDGGKIEFGTEVVHSSDGTLAALLGASPGASLLVPIILETIEECFADRLATEEWQTRVKEIIPSYGISIVSHENLFMSIREDTLSTLKLDVVK